MKGITIWQPYASLIICGLKRFETRHWATDYRGPLVIHAAKRWDEDRAYDYQRVMKLLKIMGGLVPAMTPQQQRIADMPIGETLGKALGIVQLSSCEAMMDGGSELENAVGYFGEGRFGWECREPRPFVTPYHYVGKQGLWTYTNPINET